MELEIGSRITLSSLGGDCTGGLLLTSQLVFTSTVAVDTPPDSRHFVDQGLPNDWPSDSVFNSAVHPFEDCAWGLLA
jgi:hypothetical protein